MPVLTVGIAEYKLARPPDTLTAIGLGSCVAVSVFDRAARVGGLAHVLLPSSSGYSGHNRGKFADSAVEDMVRELTALGARRGGLVAKLTGGASMFEGYSGSAMKIGEANSAACREALSRLKIPVVASETGGNFGRTVEFNVETGAIKIKTVGSADKYI